MTYLPPGAAGGNGLGRGADFSVGVASVRGGYSDGSIVLSNGAAVNPVGGFSGGGTGNKPIFGVFGLHNTPLGSLADIEYVWTNVVGPAGGNYLPPEPVTVFTPYLNLVVDFDDGNGPRVCICSTDQLAAPIVAACGTQSNNGLNELTYSWNGATQDVIIVGQTPPAPGGVAPNVSVGPLFLENSYSFQALVAANPGAVLVDAFTGDGGLPAGTITPAVMLITGDSNGATRAGKKILSMSINGSSVF